MQNLAYVSPDMASSIGVHGGAQQLMDILQAGFQQVRVWLTCLLVNLHQAVNNHLHACFYKTARRTSNAAY